MAWVQPVAASLCNCCSSCTTQLVSGDLPLIKLISNKEHCMQARACLLQKQMLTAHKMGVGCSPMVGEGVGKGDGLATVAFVGAGVGEAVAAGLGVGVAVARGDAVAATVAAGVAAGVGEAVGALVGEAVAAGVAAAVGEGLGDEGEVAGLVGLGVGVGVGDGEAVALVVGLGVATTTVATVGAGVPALVAVGVGVCVAAGVGVGVAVAAVVAAGEGLAVGEISPAMMAAMSVVGDVKVVATLTGDATALVVLLVELEVTLMTLTGLLTVTSAWKRSLSDQHKSSLQVKHSS